MTEIYRIGLEVASKNRIGNKVEYYCAKYNTEQLGGVSKLDDISLFSGLSIKLYLWKLLINKKGGFFLQITE